jgi:hypothetical protein
MLRRHLAGGRELDQVTDRDAAPRGLGLATALHAVRKTGRLVFDTLASERFHRQLSWQVILWKAAPAGALPGASLVWRLQQPAAVTDALAIYGHNTDAVVWVLALPRSRIAGVLSGLRIIVEPQHATAAEVAGEFCEPA